MDGGFFIYNARVVRETTLGAGAFKARQSTIIIALLLDRVRLLEELVAVLLPTNLFRRHNVWIFGALRVFKVKQILVDLILIFSWLGQPLHLLELSAAVRLCNHGRLLQLTDLQVLCVRVVATQR